MSPKETSMGQTIQKRNPPSNSNSNEDLSVLSENCNNYNNNKDDDDGFTPLIEEGLTMEVGRYDNKSLAKSTSNMAAAVLKNTVISNTGLAVLCLLAVQNCSKNLLMRFVMKDQPKFLTSAAVLGSECIKLTLSVLWIFLVQRKSPASIVKYLKEDMRNTLLLIVPASCYNLQMSLEYVALANIDAAVFSVLVQTKLLCTALSASLVLKKQLKYIQVISLVLLTTGVMLCNLKSGSSSTTEAAADVDTDDLDGLENNGGSMEVLGNEFTGIMATLGIAASSGVASVYTEKVIKGGNNTRKLSEDYGLAYTQVQLALMSLVTIGLYACAKDSAAIYNYGLFHNFTPAAFGSVLMSAVGGLIVASVLKYADSILKGYATALSVLLTGMLSQVLFGTQLSMIYFMGMINVSIIGLRLMALATKRAHTSYPPHKNLLFCYRHDMSLGHYRRSLVQWQELGRLHLCKRQILIVQHVMQYFSLRVLFPER